VDRAGLRCRLFSIIDEFTREALAIEVDRSIGADTVVAVLDRIAVERADRPGSSGSTTGPVFIAHAVADWCRFSGVDTVGLPASYPVDNAGRDRATPRLSSDQ
jgi:putative transposase